MENGEITTNNVVLGVEIKSREKINRDDNPLILSM